MNINTLNTDRELRIKKRKEHYNKILQRCYNKIHFISKNRNFCFFSIPKFVIGMPLINTNKCSDYIYKILVRKGFKVSQLNNNYLLIYWGHISSYKNENPYPEGLNSNNSTNSTNSDFRNINDVDDDDNFIYDLSELKEKINKF